MQVVVPMYLGEIAPPHLRGTLGSAFLLTAVTGMLLAQVLGLPAALGTREGWPWVLASVTLPAAAQLLFLAPTLLESPRWLLMAGRAEDARSTLAALRGCTTAQDAVELEEELQLMMPRPRRPAVSRVGSRAGSYSDTTLYEAMLTPQASTLSVVGLLADPAARRPICLTVPLMAVQQFSGINNAFNYSSTFLADAGVPEEMITLIAVLMNAGNVIIVLLSTVLMDRIGRRALLMTSMASMAAACALLTVALLLDSVALVCLSIVLFVMTFGLGLGPVTWLLPAELFQMHQRAAATSLATATNWLANFGVGQAFLLIAAWLGPFSFVPFGLVLLLGLSLVRSLPETRGKTLEEIERLLRGSSSFSLSQLGRFSWS